MSDHVVDLVRAELGELVDQIADPAASQPFGLYVIPSADPAAELARHVERSVFLEVFGNSPFLLAQEYGPYEPTSVFLCVVDHKRRVPAGTVRLIVGSDATFKSLEDIERVWEQPVEEVLGRLDTVLEPARTWDVATLAVAPEYRGAHTSGLVSLALYQGISNAAFRCGTRWLVTILDTRVLRLIQSQTSKPFAPFPGVEARDYLDSPSSLPVWCDLVAWAERLADVDPSMHEIMVRSQGLEAALRNPNWSGVVDVFEELSPLGIGTPTV